MNGCRNRLSAQTQRRDPIVAERRGIAGMYAYPFFRGIARDLTVLIHKCLQFLLSCYDNLVRPQNRSAHVKVEAEHRLFQQVFVLLHIGFRTQQPQFLAAAPDKTQGPPGGMCRKMPEDRQQRHSSGGIVPGTRPHRHGIIVGSQYDALLFQIRPFYYSRNIPALRLRLCLFQGKVHFLHLITNQPEGICCGDSKSGDHPVSGEMLPQPSGIQGSLLCRKIIFPLHDQKCRSPALHQAFIHILIGKAVQQHCLALQVSHPRKIDLGSPVQVNQTAFPVNTA